MSEYAPLFRSALLDVDEVEAADEGVVVAVAVDVAVAAAAAFLLLIASALVALRSVLFDEPELAVLAFCFFERAVVSVAVVVVGVVLLLLCCCCCCCCWCELAAAAPVGIKILPVSELSELFVCLPGSLTLAAGAICSSRLTDG